MSRKDLWLTAVLLVVFLSLQWHQYRHLRQLEQQLATQHVCGVVTFPNTVIVHDEHEGPPPTWDGRNWHCAPGYDIYADETELMNNRPFVHCVR